MRMILVCVLLSLVFAIFECSSDSTSPGEEEIEGDFLFVEMFIYSYAKQISGNCEQGPVVHGGNGIYEYMEDSQTFRHILGEEFPINEQLSMVFAQRQFFVYSILGGGDITWVIPVYFTPDQITEETYLEGFSDSSVYLGMNLKHFKQTVQVQVDSIFDIVIKEIEQGPGADCIWEYTDSLVVRNYGFVPKKNFIRQF